MKHLDKLLIVFCLIGYASTIQAQETIPTTGGNATGTGGTASYTIGQVIYTTEIGTSGSVAQGVQQPFEISVVSGIESKGMDLNCSVYPNPATDILTLKVENYNKEKLEYRLIDISGKVLEIKRIVANNTEISVTNLLPATYFLKVSDNGKEVKTFKIIKN